MRGNVIGYQKVTDRQSGDSIGYWVYVAETIAENGVGISARSCFVFDSIVDSQLNGDINSIYHKDVLVVDYKNNKGTNMVRDLAII